MLGGAAANESTGLLARWQCEMDRTQWSGGRNDAVTFRKQRVQKKQAIAREAYNGIYFDNGTIKGFFPKHGEGKNIGLGSGQWAEKIARSSRNPAIPKKRCSPK